MKLILHFLVLVTFLVQINSQAVWNDESHMKITVPVKASRGFCFSPKAERVRFDITCSDACDVVLLTKSNFKKLEYGVYPESHYMKTFTTDADFVFYDTRFISQTMCVAVRNPGYKPENFKANFIMGNFMEAQPVLDNSAAIILGVTIPSIGGIGCILLLMAAIIGSIFAYRNYMSKQVKIKYDQFDEESEDAYINGSNSFNNDGIEEI
eukprot:gene1041-9945_t